MDWINLLPRDAPDPLISPATSVTALANPWILVELFEINASGTWCGSKFMWEEILVCDFHHGPSWISHEIVKHEETQAIYAYQLPQWHHWLSHDAWLNCIYHWTWDNVDQSSRGLKSRHAIFSLHQVEWIDSTCCPLTSNLMDTIVQVSKLGLNVCICHLIWDRVIKVHVGWNPGMRFSASIEWNLLKKLLLRETTRPMRWTATSGTPLSETWILVELLVSMHLG